MASLSHSDNLAIYLELRSAIGAVRVVTVYFQEGAGNVAIFLSFFSHSLFFVPCQYFHPVCDEGTQALTVYSLYPQSIYTAVFMVEV